MNAYYSDGSATLYPGDCRAVLTELPPASVQCVVTSPPYWAQRDYGLEPSVWGGDPECEHDWHDREWYENGGSATGVAGGAFSKPGPENARRIKEGRWHRDAVCALCGARLGVLGLEPTPQAWIAAMVEVMREVRRVLRDDGTVWLNLGDKYAGSGGAGGDYNKGGLKANAGGTGPAPSQDVGLAAKNLMLLPYRLAIALQDDGWIVRADIIWSKPAPMPESCTDRPTTAHEHIWLLSKRGTYFYDAEAVREPHKASSLARVAQNDGHPNWNGVWARGFPGSDQTLDINKMVPEGGRNLRSVWTMNTQPFGMEMCGACKRIYTSREYARLTAGAAVRCTTAISDDETCGGTSWIVDGGTIVCESCDAVYTLSQAKQLPKARRCQKCGRDDAWVSHYAVFPEELPRKCILAGTSEKGCCPECGAPWERVVERTGHQNEREPAHVPGKADTKVDSTGWAPTTRATNRWRPTCDHDAEPVPCVVLDPFAGTGTTLKVAKALGRHAVGIELSEDYCAMAVKRLPQMAMSL